MGVGAFLFAVRLHTGIHSIRKQNYICYGDNSCIWLWKISVYTRWNMINMVLSLSVGNNIFVSCLMATDIYQNIDLRNLLFSKFPCKHTCTQRHIYIHITLSALTCTDMLFTDSIQLAVSYIILYIYAHEAVKELLY